MRKLRRVTLVGMIAGSLLLGTAMPAEAHRAPLWRPFGDHPTEQAGPGAITSGNYVRAVQMMLWAGHFYGNTWQGHVDGSFGNNTINATKGFQGWHGRTQDGIVGWYTWRDFWGYQRYTGTTSSWGGADNYYWQFWHAELIGNHWIHCPNGFIFDWFNGGHWIDHPYNGVSGPPYCVVGP